MMKVALRDIAETARGLWRDRRALVMFFITYIAMLATTALFITTREATMKDVLVSVVTMIAVPAFFFLLQAMCLNYTETHNAGELLRRSLEMLGKLALATLPVILVGLALYLILNKLDARFAPQLHEQTLRTLAHKGEAWPQVIFSALRLILFGFVIPLASIHIWIALKREGVRTVFGAIKPIMSTAFGLRSVRTYALGFLLFGVLPYILMAIRTPSERAWLEITLLSARLLLAFSLMLVGWVITVGALQRGTTAARMTNE